MDEMYPHQRKLLISGAVVVAVFMIPFILFSAHRSSEPTATEGSATSSNAVSAPSTTSGTETSKTDDASKWDPSAIVENPPASDIPKIPPKPNADKASAVSEEHIMGKGTPEMLKLAHDILDKKMGPAEAGMLINEKGYVPAIISVNGEKQKNVAPSSPLRFGMILNGESGNIIVTDIQLGD